MSNHNKRSYLCLCSPSSSAPLPDTDGLFLPTRWPATGLLVCRPATGDFGVRPLPGIGLFVNEGLWRRLFAAADGLFLPTPLRLPFLILNCSPPGPVQPGTVPRTTLPNAIRMPLAGDGKMLRSEPSGLQCQAEERLLSPTALRELTTAYHAFTLDVDVIDCSFCGAMRLASDCSCLSLAMRLSRFLCASNPAYPHPLDLPGRPNGQCPDCPTGRSCPWSQISRQANRQVRLSQHQL
jgi:hypothetical protein